jgi:hypothetical protein
MKARIVQGWNWMRILRIIAGLAITIQGVYAADWLFAIAGMLFTALALLNMGCCATTGCGYTNNTGSKKVEETTYEEVV